MMEWLKIDKYALCTSNMQSVIVVIKNINMDIYLIEVADYEEGLWVRNKDGVAIEDKEHVVTHFCIPGSIKLDD